MKLKRLSNLAKHLDKYPGELGKHAKKAVGKLTDRLVNARGKGIRFARIKGRIVPIKPRKSK